MGKALQLIHADPTHPWQVTERLQLAARLLRDTDEGIAAIAARVGYDSEAAFSRAFKRQAGESPAAWRTGARAARADPAVIHY